MNHLSVLSVNDSFVAQVFIMITGRGLFCIRDFYGDVANRVSIQIPIAVKDLRITIPDVGDLRSVNPTLQNLISGNYLEVISNLVISRASPSADHYFNKYSSINGLSS